MRKLEAVVGPDELSCTDIALIAGLLGIPTGEPYPQPDLSPQQRKDRTFALLRRRLASLAERQPVLMLLEDAHWADPSSLELFDTLVSQITERRILLVISFRPEFVPSWIGRAGVSLVTLTRLDRRQSAALAAQVTTVHLLTQAVLERVIAQTDGVPLFIEELTKAVLETPPDDFPVELAVPRTLQASLMARLDRLPAARQVAQIGAVIGREFSHHLLIAAAGFAEVQLTEGLDELVAAGLLFRRGLPPEASYTFKHALVQETAYESLLKRRRQDVHRRIAETVRDQFPEWADAEPEIVAHHFTQAGFSALAVEWWGRAGDLAMRRSAYAEALAHLEMAIKLADDLEDGPDQRRSRLRLRITYGNALKIARGFGVAETQAAFALACDIAVTVEDVSERFPAYFGLFTGSISRGDLKPIQEAAAAFLRDAESRPGSPEAVVAEWMCGMTRRWEGNFVEAQRHLEQALAIANATRHREQVFRYNLDVTAVVLVSFALTLWPLGALDRAGSLVEEALTYVLPTKHIPTIALVYVYAINFEIMRRDRAQAALYVRALLSLAHEHAITDCIALTTFHEGWLLAGSADREAGRAKIHEGMGLVRAQQMESHMPLYSTVLAETEAETRGPEAGLAIVDEQLATNEQNGQRWYLSELYRARGEMLRKCRPSDAAAAEAAFICAIDVARSQSAKLFELQAAVSLARLWCDQGKHAKARDLLGPSYNWFTEGFGAPVLKDAKALLEQLSP